MQRVTRSTAVAVLPAPPSGAGDPGFFTGGNPGTGTPATVPGYEWFNGVQEELISLIIAAGLSPDGDDNGQVAQAVENLINDIAVVQGDFTGANQTLASVGMQRLPGGLILQWGFVASVITGATGTPITFPLAFPNQFVAGGVMHTGAGVVYGQIRAASNVGGHLIHNFGTAIPLYWFAVGY
jgi:hypothetical protein